MIKHESIVREEVLSEFPTQGPVTLMNYAANLVGLPETLAVAALLWPQVIEDDGLIFISEFYHITPIFATNENRHQNKTNDEKRYIERIANACSLGQLFWREKHEVLENEKLLDAFCATLKFFWSLRLKELFPEKNFVFEVGQNIAREEGLTLTFYQEW